MEQNTKAETFPQVSGRFNAEFHQSLIDIFGSRYVSSFDDSKVIDKGKLDKKLVDLFNNHTGIILSGNVGVGKTMALIYIYKKIIEYFSKDALDKNDLYLYDFNRYAKKIQVYFAPRLFSQLHNGEKVSIAEFVMIDDLGREYAEPFALSQFEVFIEDVYKQKDVALIITTNLPLQQFKTREGWVRINDRLMETCSWFELKGESRRHK